MSADDLRIDGQLPAAGLSLEAMVGQVLHSRGIDPSQVDLQTPVMDPRGWRFEDRDEGADHFTTHALRVLGTFADGEFDFDRLPEINVHVARWAQGQREDPQRDPLLLLRGTVGCGKTSQLFNLLRELVLWHARRAERYEWYFITHRNLAAAVQPGSGRDPDRLIKLLMEARGVVVLDDLGDYNAQDFGRGADATSRIINHRAHHRLPLAMSTNLAAERGEKVREAEALLGRRIAVLADSLDDRAISRLKSGWRVTMPEIDHRAGQGKVFGP